MKHISKKTSPPEFESWKAYREPTNWNDLPGNRAVPPPPAPTVDYAKSDLRAALHTEQQGLCCYCNQALENTSSGTAIDHVSPKQGTQNQDLLFDYHNLALSCKGNEKPPKPRHLHCDAQKGNRTLPLTPFETRCETAIRYALDGGVAGTSPDAMTTICYLNLNIKKLQQLRAAAIAGFIYEDEDKTILIEPAEAKSLLTQLTTSRAAAGELTPFIVALQQSLAGISGGKNKK